MNAEKRKGEVENCVSLPIWSREAPPNLARCDIRHRVRSRRLRRMNRAQRRSRQTARCRFDGKSPPRKRDYLITLVCDRASAKPRSGARMQPTAQAVGGKRKK